MESPPNRRGARARVLIAPGPAAAEALLLDALKKLHAEAAADACLLGLPVLVIVPSESLRQHLCVALLDHLGRPAAGIAFQTLYRTAQAILERAGEPVPRGALLFPIFVRQAARAEPLLEEALDPLDDGYESVTRTVSDLIDAGFAAENLDDLSNRIAGSGAGPAAQDRARAILRVAARTLEMMEVHGLGHRSAIYARALPALLRNPEGVLPGRAVFIHGFADATGSATRLITGILRTRAAVLHLDHPPRPGAPAETDAGAAFTGRFHGRLQEVAETVQARSDPPAAPDLELLEAMGTQAEVRAVAERIRALLDSDARPERIAIVGRELSQYRLALRLHLRRLGIPFSAPGVEGPSGPIERRARSLAALLEGREQTPVDRWLDARGFADRPGDAAALADLRLGLHAQGLSRLGDVAGLDVPKLMQESLALPLPVRRGLSVVADAGTGETVRRARHRVLPREILEAAVESAAALRRCWRSWPSEAPLARHADLLERLLTGPLGWSGEDAAAAEILDLLRALRDTLPGSLSLSLEDFLLLQRRALESHRSLRFGGRGGGVQVLSVVEARGRTFEHLFVLGLNRDAFPRTVLEDPLLSDSLRETMQPVLPDIPIKERGFDEERFLFASLFASAPHVTLSWQAASDDGKAMSPSPLLAELKWTLPDLSVTTTGSPQAPAREDDGKNLRPAHEHAVLAGVHGSRAGFGEIFTEAVGEALEALGDGAPPLAATDVAQGRLAVLHEMDPDFRTREGQARVRQLGPYHGFVGASGATEPGAETPFITTIENMAICPWRTLLAQTLKIEHPPESVGALLEIDSGLVGKVVHAALDLIVRSALGEGRDALAEAVKRGPVPVTWPDDETVTAILDEASRAALEEASLGAPGLARVLARMARAYLLAARETDWPAPGQALPVVATEVQGEATLEDSRGADRTVRFRADRVDIVEERLRFTDYKSGRGTISSAAKEETRAAHFVEEIRTGKKLQAVAYALAEGAPDAEGRYLFLHPDFDDESRVFSVRRGNGDAEQAFFGTVRTALRAWDAGSFFPRLRDPAKDQEPRACSYCAVSQACLRGDSGATTRLERWVERARKRGGSRGAAAESSLFDLWTLWDKPAKEKSSGGKRKE